MPSKKPCCARKSLNLSGKISVPGDKSISHRSLMLASVAIGESKISHLLLSGDVLSTLYAMEALGVAIRLEGEDCFVRGVGLCGLKPPTHNLDFGNSGTGVRLAMGLLASHPMRARLVGDRSLMARPMGRVMDPLRRMGVRFLEENGEKLPLVLVGSDVLLPIVYHLPVPSAQVKSAILLAGLGAPGETTVVETAKTRDHTERMLSGFGASLECTEENGRYRTSLLGQKELRATTIEVPGDPSSAAFLIAAALLTQGSTMTLERILLNPTRTGFLTTLQEMGGDLSIDFNYESGGERIGRVTARSSALHGVRVPPERAPSMIDEYPILAVVAAFARGTTRMEGLSELKVKESNRLAAIVDGLMANGVHVRVGEDWLEVDGGGEQAVRNFGGGYVKTHMDHRISMAFLVMGLALDRGVCVDDISMIETSFPNFLDLLGESGAIFDFSPKG